MSQCPTCRKPAPKAPSRTSPFCSERCRQVDLGKWLNEEYRVPAEDDEGSLGEEAREPS